MTRRRRLATCGPLTALVAVTLGGCSLLVDTSGLTGDATGAGGDGGSGDAAAASSTDGPSNDGAPGGAARCPSFAIFCDDFESGNTSKWSYTSTSANGALTVVGPGAGMPNPWAGAFALRVYGGKNAAPAGGGPPPESLAQVRLKIAPVFSGTVFYRFYLYLPAALTTDTSLAKLGHQNTMTGPDDINLKVVAANGSDRFRINTDNSVANDSNHDAMMAIPLAKWTCVEVGLTLAAAGHISVWNDGVQVIDANENTVGTATAPYDQLRLGFSSTPGGITQQFYADDYVYATQRIGCE